MKTIDIVSEKIGWNNMLGTIRTKMNYDWNRKLYLILSDGWVYEGYIDEIVDVLSDVDQFIDDFYIVSPEFDQIVCYCEDGECLFI